MPLKKEKKRKTKTKRCPSQFLDPGKEERVLFEFRYDPDLSSFRPCGNCVHLLDMTIAQA